MTSSTDRTRQKDFALAFNLSSLTRCSGFISYRSLSSVFKLEFRPMYTKVWLTPKSLTFNKKLDLQQKVWPSTKILTFNKNFDLKQKIWPTLILMTCTYGINVC
jgi:hypothetical protein